MKTGANPDREKMRRERVLEFIVGFIEQRGYSPTVREIGKAVGLRSPSSVHAQLATLKRMGKVTWNETLPRTVRPTGAKP